MGAWPPGAMVGDFFGLMAGLIDAPWAAGVVGLALVGLYTLSRRRLVLVGALAWLLYLPYEYAMKLRLLCTGECNIRLDLVLLYPALAGLTAAALTAAAFGRRRPPRTTPWTTN
jgi:hypothetical protein